MLRAIRRLSGNAGVSRVDRYDLALAALPVPLLVAASSTPTRTGLFGGAALSAAMLGHLLFRDPPTGRGPGRRLNEPSA
ncbi:hypothetical protein BRC82_02600 [Halobacteriales archaeon QS_1_67_19]|nr:MAG: hypothetical protein BRC82_02600 [Halobacteriales archaeon QS_1_67_19]